MISSVVMGDPLSRYARVSRSRSKLLRVARDAIRAAVLKAAAAARRRRRWPQARFRRDDGSGLRWIPPPAGE